MKRKQRIAAALLAAALTLTLAACGAKPPAETTAPPETTASPEPSETRSTDETTAAAGETEAATRAPVYDEPVERCELFAVTLPESWYGRYVCETDETGLSFYHLQAKEAGEASALIFSLQLTEQPSDVENVGPLGDASYEVCELTTPDAAYYITRYDNVPEMFPEAYRQELTGMLNELGDLRGRLSAAGEAELAFFDYTRLEGGYVCEKAAYGYVLRLFGAERNVLQAEMKIASKQGGGEFIVAGTLRMFNGGGILFCETSGGTVFSCVVRTGDLGLRIAGFGTSEAWAQDGPYEFLPM